MPKNDYEPIVRRVAPNFATGTAAISASYAVADGEVRRLLSVTVKLSAAPTTAGNFTVTKNNGAGAVYDIPVDTENMAGLTSHEFYPDEDIILNGGDALDIAYSNPDGRTYGLEMIWEVIR